MKETRKGKIAEAVGGRQRGRGEIGGGEGKRETRFNSASSNLGEVINERRHLAALERRGKVVVTLSDY